MEPFLGQLQAFGFNFVPRGWALCDGQLLSISENTALFSLLGTTYGGDGRTTFGLPDLSGRVPMGQGTGQGLSDRRLGAKFGSETNHITVAQMPAHNHIATNTADIKVAVNNTKGEESTPSGQFLAGGNNIFLDEAGTNQNLGGVSGSVITTVGNTGGGQAVNNIQPSQVVNYCIAIVGLFPSRS